MPVAEMHDPQFTVSKWLSEREPDLCLDEDGVAGLQRDSNTLLILEVPRDSEICHLYAPVTALPEENPEFALVAALELNRFGRPLGGCWLAWDPDIAMLTLCHNLSVPANDAVSFNNTIDNFLIALDQAREEFLKNNIEESQPDGHLRSESVSPEMQEAVLQHPDKNEGLIPINQNRLA